MRLATRTVQKELLCVIDRPALDYVLDELAEAGIDRVVIAVGQHDASVAEYLARRQGDIAQLRERGPSDRLAIEMTEPLKPLGLGYSVYRARSYLADGPCVVALGDNLIDPEVAVLKRLLDEHRNTGASVIAMTRVDPAQAFRYGCAAVEIADSTGMVRVRDIIEKPEPGSAPSNIVCVGRYVLTPSLFELIGELRPGRNGEIQLVDAISMLAKAGEVYGVIFDDVRYDIGHGVGMIQAEVEIGLRRSEMAADIAVVLDEALRRYRSRR